MSDCTLCSLDVGADGYTAADVEGRFCCRGCLEVARVVDDVAEAHRDGDGGLDFEEAMASAGEDAAVGASNVPDDAAETYLSVDGMHCTTCEAFLRLQGGDVDGVYTVEANYGTGTMRIVFDAETVNEADLPDLLSGYGYRVRFRESDATGGRDPRLETLQRLVVGGFFTMLIMPWYLFYLYPSYVGIETGILDIDTTSAVGIYLPMALIGLMSSVVLFYTGYPVLRGAWVSLRTRHPNMDLLVSVAALSAFAYSVVALATGSTHLYFDVSVAVIMVVTVGRYYEDGIRARATKRLSEVTAARVDRASRLTDGGRETVERDALEPGDRVVVSPGERVPVDGTIADGVADVDESVLTGEALPVTRRPGDSVVGGSRVIDDTLVVTVGSEVESTVDRIASALWEIQTSSPGVQRIADALATVFVPVVLTLGTIVTVWQLLGGSPVAAAMLAGLTVLVVSCPCAMGLATPLAVSGGLRDALERGIVVTNESLFEVAPDAETVIFDKTGTLTAGEMQVSEVWGPTETLRLAASVERLADHPVADAIMDAQSEDSPVLDPTEFTRHPGSGVSATVDGHHVVVGTPGLVTEACGPLPDRLTAHVDRVTQRGGLPIVVGWDDEAQGVVAVEDRVRDGWADSLEAVSDCEIVVLTGDDVASAARFRDHPAIDDVFAGVPPDGKAETVRRYAAAGTTVMVGDGTNDATALAAADLGIAMGDGTARAVDAADVVVLDSDLGAVKTVFDLADGTHRRIRENIVWAFGYNAVAIPLAVVGLINPLFAALAMAASSVVVVSNSTRSVLPTVRE